MNRAEIVSTLAILLLDGASALAQTSAKSYAASSPTCSDHLKAKIRYPAFTVEKLYMTHAIGIQLLVAR